MPKCNALQHDAHEAVCGAADYSIILELGKQQLAERIHRDGWQPSGHEAMCAARQLAAAMCHLHDKGVLHRDINPSNVLFGKLSSVSSLNSPQGLWPWPLQRLCSRLSQPKKE